MLLKQFATTYIILYLLHIPSKTVLEAARASRRREVSALMCGWYHAST